ncbi:tetratricopeptide repeat-containing sensor histidine kinase [Tenacibaculum mesophilum]|uniref:Tetratricopeptide repeat protein n=1 Tax=Tenacibaculum mesophilum TaxID=104268 RepID=A0ABN5T6W4_9FLAO|nr:tetratricopeptide repeat protein [Tenacibaculum mesophilum]AZJ33107.1 tetratricopeptide repeat protein [Tenacibaculum mesophilum]QFS28357.1 tetratricopeptide repeat protein [Tenacibaculum mesophilum]SHF67203.1 Tetratricopeptide repeat-containing protein [Tenacibaculum mesophilum]
MKKLIITTFLFFIVFLGFSQRDKNTIDSLIKLATEKKIDNYYDLQRLFKRKNFEEEEITFLLNKSKKVGYKLGEIHAYNLLGKYYRNNSFFDSSIKSHIRALDLSKEIKDVNAEIVTLNQIGVVYRRQDKIRSALNYHQMALELADKIEFPDVDTKISISISNNSIGNIYLALKQYQLALEKFKKSILIQEKTNDKRGLAINHQNIGLAFQNLGDIDAALEHYNKSLQYNVENNSSIGKVICHTSISKVLLLQGKYKEAYKYINEVVSVSEGIGNHYYTSDVYVTFGSVLLKLDSLDKAKVYLEESLEVANKHKIPSGVNHSNLYLSELYEKKKNYEKAYSFYKKAIEGERKTFNDKNILYVNNLINKYDNEVSNNKIKSLAKENEIAKLKLLRNRNVLIIALVSIALLGVLLYSIYRQRLLNNDKKILMLEQEALRIQMNPHFVFNALNSIKLYVINNEQKNAVYYLNKFSKLIRSILESSSVKEVTLSEELKTMNLYMSIENIRLSNEVNYIEKVDEGVNIERIKVPPLILQPFLENSIWHGLSSKKGKKEVSLSVTKISDEFIQIDIVDNGIGRDAAMKIRKNKSLNRRSIGIDLTKERLRNFANEYANNYSLIYTDIIDKEGNPKGTKVSLKIPIL